MRLSAANAQADDADLQRLLLTVESGRSERCDTRRQSLSA